MCMLDEQGMSSGQSPVISSVGSAFVMERTRATGKGIAGNFFWFKVFYCICDTLEDTHLCQFISCTCP